MPFLGVQGFMVTKFAATHDVESLAKDLVSSYMMQSGAQLELALANGRFPANLTAGKQVKDPQLKAFGAASDRRRPDAEHPADELASGVTSARHGCARRRAEDRSRPAARSSARPGASRRRSARSDAETSAGAA